MRGTLVSSQNICVVVEFVIDVLNPAHTGRINQNMMDSACVENMAFISSQEKNPATRYIQYKIRIQRVNTFQNPYISLSD